MRFIFRVKGFAHVSPAMEFGAVCLPIDIFGARVPLSPWSERIVFVTRTPLGADSPWKKKCATLMRGSSSTNDRIHARTLALSLVVRCLLTASGS